MIVLVVHWQAHTGQEEEVVRVFSRLAAESRQEPGCRMYLVHQHKEDKRRFLVYEQYDDEAALEAHRASAHFQELARKRLPELGERIAGDLYDPLP